MINRYDDMYLLGVIPDIKYLDFLEKLILKSKEKPKSMLVELPTNWNEALKKGIANQNSFFHKLAERFRKRGTKIFYGDMPIAIGKKDSEDMTDLVDCLVRGNHHCINSRVEGVFKALNKFKPQYIVIERAMADRLTSSHDDLSYNLFAEKDEARRQMDGRYSKVIILPRLD